MTDEREAMIEEVTTAWRPVDHRELRSHPTWHDLDEASREEAHDRTTEQRTLEAALHPLGMSSTVARVLARLSKA